MEFLYRNKQYTISGISPKDHIFRQVISHKTFYETDLLEYIDFITRAKRSEQSICIDVGANIGNHSIYFGGCLGTEVICFEPNQTVLPCLKENLKNNLKRYVVYACALGASEGKGSIHLPEGFEDNIGAAQIKQSPHSNTNDQNLLEIQTLDKILTEKKGPTIETKNFLF